MWCSFDSFHFLKPSAATRPWKCSTPAHNWPQHRSTRSSTMLSGQSQQGYARSRFQLRRVEAGDSVPPVQPQTQAQQKSPQQQYRGLGKFKLVRQGSHCSVPAASAQQQQQQPNRPTAPAGQNHADARPPPRDPAARTSNSVATRQQHQQRSAAAPASNNFAGARQPALPPPQQQRTAVVQGSVGTRVGAPQAAVPLRGPAGAAAGAAARAGAASSGGSSSAGMHKVLDRAGSQQRILVYSKGKGGKSLQRAGVKALAGGRVKGSLTWRNPAAATAAAAGTAPRAKPAATLARAAAAARPVGVVQRPAAHKLAATATPLRSKKKWNKYVRASPRPCSDKPTAKPATVLPRPLQPTARGAAPALPLKSRSTAMSKASRILRLGSSLYKVQSKGRSRSLHRQRSSPPQQQQQQQHIRPAATAPAAAPAAVQGQLRRSGGSKAPRLLRLGSSMYKVQSKGGSRSLLRQRASPLQQQQQQQQAQRAITAHAPATAAAAKPSGRAALALRVVGGIHKAQPAARSSSLAAQLHSRGSSGGSRVAGASVGRGSGRIVYCPVYCHTGKCARRGKGCPYKHDTTKRAVCPRWLHGKCEDAKCPLQHQRKKELMPACMHFLKGLCTATDCPYLHVNLAPDAPVCKAFLRGYCPAGADCPHKHYTLRMVKEERRLEQQGGGGAGAERPAGKMKRLRYFSAQQPSAKRARGTNGSGAAPGAGMAVVTGEVAGGSRQEAAGSRALQPDFFMDDIIPL